MKTRFTGTETSNNSVQPRREPAPESVGTARLPYAAPALLSLEDVDALLEVLGPAQANYGGF